jgi:cytochrome P450
MGVDTIDVRSPAFVADPYPHYARLRAQGPMHRPEPDGDWWAVGHGAAVEVLSDRHMVKGRGGAQEMPPPPGHEHLPPLRPSMLMRDPPDHTRLRGLVNRAFTPGAVAALRPRIEALADELLDAAESRGRGRMDLIGDFAGPLPAIVIAELLGVPPGDRPRFQEWSRDVVLLLDSTQPEEVRVAGMAARVALLEYFHALLRERRRSPGGGGLIADLLEAEEAGDRLTPGEVLTMCMLLLTAGHETTTHLIGTGTRALLRQRDQWTRLLWQPELVPDAVEELLRFEPPVHLDGRVASEDVEIAGHTVREGEWVLAVIGSANRDETVWPDPERLDVGRRPNPHLAFGRGIHFCLGAPLARMEGQIALAALLRRFPRLEPDPALPAEWNRNLVIRGMRRFGVRWS